MTVRIAALLALCATVASPEVVAASVLNATWAGGGEQPGFAYVYRTKGAELYVNDAANRKAQMSVSDCPAKNP